MRPLAGAHVTMTGFDRALTATAAVDGGGALRRSALPPRRGSVAAARCLYTGAATSSLLPRLHPTGPMRRSRPFKLHWSLIGRLGRTLPIRHPNSDPPPSPSYTRQSTRQRRHQARTDAGAEPRRKQAPASCAWSAAAPPSGLPSRPSPDLRAPPQQRRGGRRVGGSPAGQPPAAARRGRTSGAPARRGLPPRPAAPRAAGAFTPPDSPRTPPTPRPGTAPPPPPGRPP